MAEGEIEDLSGKIKITWFNQAYLAKMIKEGENVKLTGKVTQGKNNVYLANPEFEKLPNMPIDMHDTLFKKKNIAIKIAMAAALAIKILLFRFISKLFIFYFFKINVISIFIGVFFLIGL